MNQTYERNTAKSRRLFERARRVFPAGVSYRIRSIEPYPFYVKKAKGSKMEDVDENTYTDYWCGHFALILGHAPPEVVKAVKEQADRGFHYGVAHELELELAEQICKMIPSAQLLRFCGSGTEANMFATRLARTYTHRTKIGKFQGCWHGAYDPLHVAVKLPFDKPASGGLTEGALKDTVILPYNNLDETRRIMSQHELASVVIEPVMGGSGMIPANREFLKGLSELCEQKDTLLIFDEVVTGFRLGPGGAQREWGVTPHLTILGKILGGGLPASAVTGRREIMEHLDHTKFQVPEYCFHGGTQTGNPMAMTAGLATLRTLEKKTVYKKIDLLGDRARRELNDIFNRAGFDFQTTGVGSVFGCHFTKVPVVDTISASKGNRKLSERFCKYLLDKGIFALTAELVHCAISNAHTRNDIEEFLSAAEGFARQARHVKRE
jgi:glutamate-1-semialdehyde 2,1-aminomutase